MRVVQLVSWRPRVLADLPLHLLIRIRRLDDLEDGVVRVASGGLLLDLELAWLGDLGLPDRGLARRDATGLDDPTVAFVSLLLMALRLVVYDVLPLGLTLVGVNKAAELVHFLALGVRLLKATLLG